MARPLILPSIGWSPETRRIPFILVPALTPASLAIEFYVFDHGDVIAVGEEVAVGIVNVTHAVAELGEPLVATGGALESIF